MESTSSSMRRPSLTAAPLVPMVNSEMTQVTEGDRIGAGTPLYMAVPAEVDRVDGFDQTSAGHVVLDVGDRPRLDDKALETKGAQTDEAPPRQLASAPGQNPPALRPSLWVPVEPLAQQLLGDLRDLGNQVRHHASPDTCIQVASANPRLVVAACALATVGAFVGLYFEFRR